MPPLDLNNSFWRFSLKVYAAPGVEKECLALQAVHGLDVNLLLFGAWLGAERAVALDAASTEQARAAAASWQENVVQPLRAARKAVKAASLAADPALAGLRADLAGTELKAEQIEQAMLFAWAEAAGLGKPLGGSIRDVAASNLALVLRAFAPEPADAAAPALLNAALEQVPKQHAGADQSSSTRNRPG